jgi:hypothetical protein
MSARLRVTSTRAPLPVPTGSVIEVERTVSASGNISIGNHVLSIGQPLAGQRVTIRLDGPLAHIHANGTLARTMACPVPEQARALLRGARPGTATPPQLPEAQQVKRQVSVRGTIMIGSQRIQAGLPHAGKTATVTVEADTYQVTVDDGPPVTAPRKASCDIKRHKASNYQA